MDTWTSPRRPSESPRGAASAEVRHPPRLGRLPFPPGLCVGRSHTRRLPRAKCHHHCKPSSHPMARLKGFAGYFYTLELGHGEPTRAQLPSAVPLRGRATHDEDGWGGRFACALVRAPHAGRCALLLRDRVAAGSACKRCALWRLCCSRVDVGRTGPQKRASGCSVALILCLWGSSRYVCASQTLYVCGGAVGPA